MSETPPPTPRERARLATVERIKAAAREQMSQNGSARIVLRAVARDIGMTTPALYRYFESLDGLVADLAEDACTALTQAMQSALDALPKDAHAERWRALCEAYRRWALASPAEFGLLFGDTCPSQDVLAQDRRDALRRFVAVPAGEYLRAIEDGAVRLPDRAGLGPRAPHLAVELDVGAGSLTPMQRGALVSAGASVLGFVSLALSQRATHRGSADPDVLFAAQVGAVMEGMGYVGVA